MKLRVASALLKDMNKYKHARTGIASLQVIEIRLLELIAQHMGFSYELVFPVDERFGFRLPDGNWTGIIGMIKRDEADLSVALLSLSMQRMQAIDFSDSYWMQDTTFMTELPPLLPKTYFYSYPFTLGVWLAFLSVMIITAFFLVPGEGFGAVLMTFMRGLCRQSVNVRYFKTVARKLLLIHWLYFANFVTLSYCAVVLSFLSVPLRNKGVETIDDLCRAVKGGSYKALVSKGSSILQHIVNSSNENVKDLGSAILNNHWDYDTREGIDNYFEYGTAFIGSEMKFRGASFPRKFISKDSFGVFNVAVALNRHFCCKKRLNVLLRRIVGAGLFQKIIEEEWFKTGLGQQNFQSDSIDHRSASLSIDDLYGVFAVLVAGYIASGVVFLLELVANYVCNVKKTCYV
ncbi:hypothetical protein JTE90_025966 [Oedothorax gibbosus]|uniref:Ionotropic glutamate receptor L-glutamate and glycine-binding domain-containing protein n=1 Tax=Oedothorax gibbosus TaxID=931172 RepID=A0AAV6U395_9ARAC|nr:hypothetical protein JTE90_025966 [Oedothorax gibbosus]